jgi:hypothetical protein
MRLMRCFAPSHCARRSMLAQHLKSVFLVAPRLRVAFRKAACVPAPQSPPHFFSSLIPTHHTLSLVCLFRVFIHGKSWLFLAQISYFGTPYPSSQLLHY